MSAPTQDPRRSIDTPVVPLSGRDPEKMESRSNSTSDEEAAVPEMGSPAAEPVKERWNSSRTNIFRFSMTVYSFIIMGMSDGALGVSPELPLFFI